MHRILGNTTSQLYIQYAVVTFQINTCVNLDQVFLAHGFKLMDEFEKLTGMFPNDDRLITSLAIIMAVRKTHLHVSTGAFTY